MSEEDVRGQVLKLRRILATTGSHLHLDSGDDGGLVHALGPVEVEALQYELHTIARRVRNALERFRNSAVCRERTEARYLKRLDEFARLRDATAKMQRTLKECRSAAAAASASQSGDDGALPERLQRVGAELGFEDFFYDQDTTLGGGGCVHKVYMSTPHVFVEIGIRDVDGGCQDVTVLFVEGEQHFKYSEIDNDLTQTLRHGLFSDFRDKLRALQCQDSASRASLHPVEEELLHTSRREEELGWTVDRRVREGLGHAWRCCGGVRVAYHVSAEAALEGAWGQLGEHCLILQQRRSSSGELKGFWALLDPPVATTLDVARRLWLSSSLPLDQACKDPPDQDRATLQGHLSASRSSSGLIETPHGLGFTFACVGSRDPLCVIHRLPFTSVASLPPMLCLTRQQLVFNALFASCFPSSPSTSSSASATPSSSPPPPSLGGTARLVELSSQAPSFLCVHTLHPLTDHIVGIVFTIHEGGVIRVILEAASTDSSLLRPDRASRVAQTSLSVPITLSYLLG